MKQLALIVFLALGLNSFGQLDTTKLQESFYKPGHKYEGVWPKKYLGVPPDTTYSKYGIARIGTTLYVGNGTYWTAAGGSSAGYGLLGNLRVDTTKIPNYRLSDSVALASGIKFSTVKSYVVGTSIRKDQSAIRRLSDGRLFIVYTSYGASGGDGYPAVIMGAFSSDGGLTWVDHDTIVSGVGESVYIPSLEVQSDGEVVVLFTVKNGVDSASIWKTKSNSAVTTWSTAVPLTDSALYLVPGQDRIFKDDSTGYWYFPYELSSNGSEGCLNILSTGKALKSTNQGETWADAGFTIVSSDGRCEEGQMFRKADSVYYTWRNYTGAVLGRKSTDDAVTFGSQFAYNLLTPCAMNTFKYLPRYGLLINSHNQYNGFLGAEAGARAVFVIDASIDGGQTFSRVFTFPPNVTGFKHQPTIFWDETLGYVLVQYANDDGAGASLEQLIISIDNLYPKSNTTVSGNSLLFSGTNTNTAAINTNALTGPKIYNLQNYSGAYIALQQSASLTALKIPYTGPNGILSTLTNAPSIDTSTGRITFAEGINLNGISTSNGTITLQANSSASVMGARMRQSDGNYAQINFFTADGATQIASLGGMRVGTNGGSFYIVTKPDGGAAAQNFTFSNVGLYAGGSSTTPTAVIHLDGSSTARASLRFNGGVAPSSPNSGDMWYTTTNTRLMFRQNATSVELIGTSSVNSVSPTSPNRTLTVVINGTTYYIPAKTTND